MSEAITNLREIAQSPFVLSSIYPSFYTSLGPKKNSFLLSYLIIPLIFVPPSRRFIKHSKSTSSLFTLAQKRECLYGLAKIAAKYKDVTNLSVQYAMDRKWLMLEDDMSVKSLVPLKELDPARPEDYRICEKLAVLLTPYDVAMIYRTLGIRYI
jgi:hypothetical protein